jgi:hypothetical protein
MIVPFVGAKFSVITYMKPGLYLKEMVIFL